MDKVLAGSTQMIKGLSNHEGFEKCIPEVKYYFEESFGSYTRIDYGTGHEFNFVVFLFCLFKLGVLGDDDLAATVNKVFQRYLVLVRKILSLYFLEPAGSHGVWGLDDY